MARRSKGYFTGNVCPSCDPRACRPFTTGIIGGPHESCERGSGEADARVSETGIYWIVGDHSAVISRPIAVFQAHSVHPDSVDFGFLPCRYVIIVADDRPGRADLPPHYA